MTQPTKRDRYHHGNLKQELLDKALEALEQDGLEKVSLRSLAKAVGVTPTAVYGHFADKTALLIELRTRGFDQLRETLTDALEQLPASATPEDKVRALGKAYMHFATESPHMFDTLFSWTPDFARMTPECVEAGAGGEHLLRDTLVELLEREGESISEYQAALASFSAWSLVHGISTLLRTGSVEGAIYCKNWPASFSAQYPDSHARVVDHLLTIAIEGLKAAVKHCAP